MKRIMMLAILIMLLASCIGQEEKEWTVEDWKEHLYFSNPGVDQNTPGMVTGFSNIGDIPAGTYMAFKIDSTGTTEGIDMPLSMTMELTVIGRETVEGVETVAMDIAMDMDIEMMGDSITMIFEGKEWVELDGSPIKMEGTATGTIQGMEIPMGFSMKRTGEEFYEGHDCWIFEMTQSIETPGMPAADMKAKMYMDKQTNVMVRMVTDAMGQEMDTGYIEPTVPTGEIQWELGGRESITTELGTYDCQIIYVKQNGVTVGTIWANEDIRAPIKYIYSYEEGDTKMEITMILTGYSLG